MAASAWRIPGRSEVAVRNGEGGDAVRLGCVVAGPVELALQIRLGDLQIPKGHADVFVTHQFHEGWQPIPQRSISEAQVWRKR